MKWLEAVIKKFPPLKGIFLGDEVALWTYVVSGIVAVMCFLTIGIALFVNARHSAVEPGAKMRKLFTHLIAIFLTLCGLMIFVWTIAVWYNAMYVGVLLLFLTAVSGLLTLFSVPRVLKAVSQSKTLSEVSEQIEETKAKVEELQKTTEKLGGIK